MTFRAHSRWWIASLAVAVAPNAIRAQGFGLNEIGSCAIGRGFAVSATPCEDASVLFWNPAAAARLNGPSLYAGVTGIQVHARFTQDVSARAYDGDVPVTLPPFLGFVYKSENRNSVFHRVAFGIAAYVPYGLTSQWRDDFPGRFSAQTASLRSTYVQPTVAIDVMPDRLSLGGGFIVARSSLELRQSIDFAVLPAPPPAPAGTTFARLGFAPGTEFGRAVLSGDGVGYGFTLGAQAKLTETVSLGARYLSAVTFDYDGDAAFSVVPSASTYVLQANNALSAPAGTTLAQVVAPQFTGATGAFRPGQTLTTSIRHPAQFQAGVGYTGIQNTTLSADYAFVKWDAFDVLRVTFASNAALSRELLERYRNASSYRVGAEHRFHTGISGRLGFSYAPSPAPDETVTPLLPDMDRHNFAAGVGIPIGRVTFDAAYLRVETEGRRGRTGERTASQTAAQVNNGFYTLHANIFSASLKLKF